MLNYRKLIVGEMGTNCYLLWSKDKEAIIIDPGDEGTEIAQVINETGLKPIAILLTHGHFDHIMGVIDLQLIFNIPVALGKEDAFLINRSKMTAEYFLKKKLVVPNIKVIKGNFTKIKLGEEEVKVIKTPGHTPGSVCFYAEKSELLFTGDTIFADGIGDTTHSYSSKSEIQKSIENIFKIKKETIVLPGHGEEISLILLKKLFLQNFVDYLA